MKPPDRPGGRLAGRAATVLLGLAVAGLLLAVAAAPWVVATPPPGPGTTRAVAVHLSGSRASALVPALALVGLAAAVALSTLRGPGRVVAGLLLVAAGGGAVAAVAAVLADPVGAASGAVRSATGLVGAAGVSASVTPWPVVALVPALALLGVGVRALVLGRRWATSARFEAPAATAAEAAGGASPSALWDDLSRGGDPTR